MKEKLFIHAMHANNKFGTSEALSIYLRDNKDSFVKITSPLDVTVRNEVLHSVCKSGKVLGTRSYFYLPLFTPLNYLRDLMVVLYICIKMSRTDKEKVFIGSDPLNALAGVALKKLRCIDKTIYYSVDYSPKRFTNKYINAVYHSIDRYVVKRSDVIWNVSKRMQAVRQRQGKEVGNLYVPNGVFSSKEIAKIEKPNKEKLEFVYAGDLAVGKGLEEMIETFSKLKYTNYVLHIYGKGELEQDLQKKIEVLNLQERILFYGRIPNKEIIKRLKYYDVGIALYTNEKSYSYYGDPVKVKEYLASGLYILVSDIPEVAEWIEKAGLGKKVGNNADLSYFLEKILRKEISIIIKTDTSFLKKINWSFIYNYALKQSGF